VRVISHASDGPRLFLLVLHASSGAGLALAAPWRAALGCLAWAAIAFGLAGAGRGLLARLEREAAFNRPRDLMHGADADLGLRILRQRLGDRRRYSRRMLKATGSAIRVTIFNSWSDRDNGGMS
jgi:hypothetical protein